MSYVYTDKQGRKRPLTPAESQIFREPNMQILVKRPYSYRDYPLGLFAEAYQKCGNDIECQVAVRQAFQHMESGRLHTALESIHKFMAHLDVDERELFRERNPELVKMMNEYAVVEDLPEY